jgi:hypothetical protein
VNASLGPRVDAPGALLVGSGVTADGLAFGL